MIISSYTASVHGGDDLASKKYISLHHITSRQKRCPDVEFSGKNKEYHLIAGQVAVSHCLLIVEDPTVTEKSKNNHIVVL